MPRKDYRKTADEKEIDAYYRSLARAQKTKMKLKAKKLLEELEPQIEEKEDAIPTETPEDAIVHLSDQDISDPEEEPIKRSVRAVKKFVEEDEEDVPVQKVVKRKKKSTTSKVEKVSVEPETEETEEDSVPEKKTTKPKRKIKAPPSTPAATLDEKSPTSQPSSQHEPIEAIVAKLLEDKLKIFEEKQSQRENFLRKRESKLDELSHTARICLFNK